MMTQTSLQLMPETAAPAVETPQIQTPEVPTQATPEPLTCVIPDEADQEGWKTLYRTLGQPETLAGYTLPETQSGQPDAALQDWFKASAWQAGLSIRQASQLAAAWEGYVGEQQAAQAAAHRQHAQDGIYDLQKEWGAAYEDQLIQAKRAVTHYGISADELDALETAMGTKSMLSLCARLGNGLKEPTLVTPPKGGGGASPASAKETITHLTKDPQFMASYLNGDTTAIARMQQVMQEAYAG